MAATKSTKNTKLPKVKEKKIGFKKTKVNAKGKKVAKFPTKISCGSNGQFSANVWFIEPSDKYPFQIQYRERSYYNKTNAQTTGASLTNWSDWKAAVTKNGITKDWTQTLHPVNQWMKSNKGINKKGKNNTFFTFTNYVIPADYVAREFEFRIRTFNKSKAKHGEWSNRSVIVYKEPDVAYNFTGEEPVWINTVGSINIHFYVKYEGDFKFQLDSLKDNDGNEILKKAVTITPEYEAEGTGTYAGYTKYVVGVPFSSIKREITTDDDLTIDSSVITDTGINKAFNMITVTPAIEEPSAAPEDDVEINSYWNDDEVSQCNVYKVYLTGEGASNIQEFKSTVTWGRSYIIDEQIVNEKISEECIIHKESDTVYYVTCPMPFDTTGCRVKFTVKTATGAIISKENSVTKNSTAGYHLQSLSPKIINDGTRLYWEKSNWCSALCWANTEFVIKDEPHVEVGQPINRKSAVAFYGTGKMRRFTLKGSVFVNESYNSASSKRAWDAFLNNLSGIYLLRHSNDIYTKVVVQNSNWVMTKPGIYEITLEMTEVE